MTTAMVAGGAARAPDQFRSPRPANRLAEKITGRSYLSHSQIALFRACPKKFSLQYVERAKKDFVPSSLAFGGSIHSALEAYFRARLEGRAVTHATLVATYQDAWKRQLTEAGQVPVRFNKNEDPDSLQAMADRLLAAFINSPLAQPKGTILGIEEELRVVLDPALPDVLAKVDLVTHTQGALHVIDWKTSRSRWTDQKAAESSDQLVLYGVTAASMSRSLHLPVKLHFGIIIKAKTPLVQILPVPTDSGRVTAMKTSVQGVWEAIQGGNFYPSPSPMNCCTCPFKSRCPVFAHA
jgi:CRISPR/Cas system-associated exonuclease Cas4 (RecB family)